MNPTVPPATQGNQAGLKYPDGSHANQAAKDEHNPCELVSQERNQSKADARKPE